MLHVFHVDHGIIMKFDTKFTTDSVGHLKNHIQKLYGIESEKQVFLTSSGKVLENNTSVASHPVGTDTNPIFLYSKKIINDLIMPENTIPAFDLKEQEMIKTIRIHLRMPGNFPTVAKRAQLAQELIDVARKHLSECQRLVHEQHLQQQGLNAVVSNLDGIVVNFEKHMKVFIKSFALFIRDRDYYLGFLKDYHNDVRRLQRIPVLTALLKSSMSQEAETEKEIDLYKWILTTDIKIIVNHLYQICSKGLKEFNGPKYIQLTTEIQEFLELSKKNHCKEVEGLNENLSMLDAWLRELKGLVGQQKDLAQAFENQKNSASATKDASVLPDLCSTHYEQLQMMERIHIRICDILRHCMKSKYDLTKNLYSKFNWVTLRQDAVCDLFSRMSVHHENFQIVERYLNFLRQMHVAPSIYAFAVSEVVRRRKFSQLFLKLSNKLAGHFCTIHKEEIMRRKQFRLQIKGHFLNSLFTGLNDCPRSFATHEPIVFDASLPQVTEEDIDRLKQELPDLADKLKVPDLPTDFFLIKNLATKGDEKGEVLNVKETKSVIEERVEAVAVSDIKLASDLDGSLLKDGFDRECVSESGSEDFENVFQSSLPSIVSTSTLPQTQDASTITEETLEIYRSENDRLKSLLLTLYQLTKEETSQLKSEISDLRSTILSNKDLMSQECKSLGSSWENVMIERGSKEREKLEITKKCHQEALDSMRRKDQEKTKQVEQLSSKKLSLESEVLKSCQDLRELRENIEKINADKVKTIHELQNKIKEVEEEKEKNIKEITDKLNRDHKAEIERIKRHFKLMTMERSPSDDNLKKSGDFASLPATMFLQIKENFELDKEKAVNEALLAEREKWKKLLDIKVRDTEIRCFHDAGILQKEYRERELEAKKQVSESLNKISMLEKEVEQLKCEYMAASDYGKVDATTSPIKQKELRSEIPSSRSGKVSIDSCKPGDLVVVVWEPTHESFKIIQENKHMFFLHSDYLEGLGLEIVNGEPNKCHIIGEVVDKEYCFARKSENRYKVPKRTKFFRVKVKPYAPSVSSKNVTQSLYQPKSAEGDTPRMMLSQTINVISEDDSIPSSLPSSPTSTHPTILERDEPDATIVERDKPDATIVERDEPDPTILERDGPDPTILERDEPDPTILERAQPGTTILERAEPDTTILERDPPDTTILDKNESHSTILERDEFDTTILVRNEPDSTILERVETDTTTTNVVVESNSDQLKIQEVECVETTFAEDSGIVENVEEAMALLDKTLTSESRNESESSDRADECFSR